jgi:hypothetical protein
MTGFDPSPNIAKSSLAESAKNKNNPSPHFFELPAIWNRLA